jgi:[ribosomal protein S18]-alanine N-acetyltransferase
MHIDASKARLNYFIREIREDEYFLLKTFLYEAIFIPEGIERPGIEVREEPKLQRYYTRFGRRHDHCLVAEHNIQVTGMIWTRVFTEAEPGYGYAGQGIPELSMSVLPEYRGLGMGKQLLVVMLEKLKALGYTRLSLSVDKDNFALHLYVRIGFKPLKTVDNSLTMLKTF